MIEGRRFVMCRDTKAPGKSFRERIDAIYLHMNSLKSVFGMKPHRDIGVTRKIARFMLQRVRAAFGGNGPSNDTESMVNDVLVGRVDGVRPVLDMVAERTTV